MPKRQHHSSDEEDDNEEISQASSKRARTVDSDEDVLPTQTRSRKRVSKGKGKTRAAETPESDDDDNGDAENVVVGGQQEEMDDEEFERVHGEKLRVFLDNRRKIQGGVAEYGIIEYIEMHQFMCHKYLKFTFGPQINFIIGHNGSGKSAVLSAITVALGGKATSTGRGNGLKSFIREGQGVAEVTIHIKNQGDESYKHKEFGDTIVITRRFTKEGSSTWKIMSKSGRVISTKKDELAAICDHMNIQVDNPMNVLTQDSARQFLSASVPQDKYKFFLRGTQLSQLSDEYQICLENITQTAKLLAVKKEALPDLRARLREVSARYEEAAKAREQKKKADDLKKELAWSHVAAKEAELEKKMEETAKLSRRLPKIEEEVNKAMSDFEKATKQVVEFEGKINSLEGVEHLTERKTDLQNQMRANKNILTGVNNDIKQMNVSMGSLTSQVEQLEKQIAEEARRMAINTQAKHEETQRRLDDAKNSVTNFESRLSEILEQRRTKSVEADNIRLDGDQLERRKDGLRNTIVQCDNTINSAKQASKDIFVPYGQNIKQVLERAKNMRWAGDVPLGPLGMHVKAKDPQKWGDVLRNMLGTYLTAFAITDARDHAPLKKLLSESGNGRVNIVIYEKDLFDYRHGEPPEHLLTVLRALEISDPYVLRIMINQAHIETQILAPTRSEAQRLLQSVRGGSAWANDGFGVRVFPEGGVSSFPISVRKLNGPLALLLTGRDNASDVKHFEMQKYDAEMEYRDIDNQVSGMKNHYMSLKQAIEILNQEEEKLQKDLRYAKQNVNRLQEEANEDLPASLAGFESAKQDAEREKETIKVQFMDVMKQKTDLDETQIGLLNQMKDVKALLDEYEDKRNAIKANVEEAVEARMKAQNAKKHYEAKHAEEKKKVDAAEDASKILQEEFTNWTDKALEYCERVEKPRKADDIQRLLASVQKALKEREKTHGASVEEMVIEVNKAKENFDKAEKELKQMSLFNRGLRSSLLVRLAKWQEFRRHIALRCKHVFQFHLSQRGYYGKILFNHDQGTLNLRVQTDDQLQTQGTRDKDPRSLSGGEKSFSTICLLLSLWECIGCPLRCLDEFDVFMDAVNRRISMKMMIETANTSDRKQYILITPQDMTNVTLGPTVRVLRMTDPERRGNGTLPFGSAA